MATIWDVILPIDELHHFSRWLLHHQAVIMNGYETILTIVNVHLVMKPVFFLNIFFILMDYYFYLYNNAITMVIIIYY